MKTALVLITGLLTVATFAGNTTTVLTTKAVDAEETTFGDLTTDALCSAATTTIAFAPAVSFKQGSIPVGPVSASAVRALLQEPEEKWAVLKLKGAQIRAALERSLSFAPTPRVFFLQVSGLKIVYTPTAPRGMKIKSVTVGANPLNDTASYEVAMPLSLAQGGSGYFTIFGSTPAIRTGNEGLASLIARYVTAQESISYTGQGRIVVGR